jgi:hypothetical protein
LRLLGDAVKREVPSHSSCDRHAERTDGKTFVRTLHHAAEQWTRCWQHRNAADFAAILDAADLSRSRRTRPKVKVRLVTDRQQASVA